MSYHTGRKTNDKQSMVLRDRSRELRQQGLKHREVAEALNISRAQATYYIKYAK